MRRTIARLTAGAAAFALAAGTGAATYATLAEPGTTVVRETVTNGELTNSSTSTIGDVARRASSSVVEITATGSGAVDPFGQGSRATEAQGSGFLYDADGRVVTNAHVVDGAASVAVTLANGKRYDATVVGVDQSTDLAVLDIDAPSSALHPVSLADSSTLAVGDTVVAIGSPFGLQNSVTAGIVSALGRSMEAPNGYTINGSIQTDAAINHGNSGGPLLDLEGQVIGVNAQIASESGGNDGVGFAIPSNTVASIVGQLIDDGTADHAYLGIGGTASEENGVRVTDVRNGSPAERAGLEVDDVITSVGNKAVSTTEALQTAIESRRPGARVAVGYVRGGATHTVNVTLSTRPA